VEKSKEQRELENNVKAIKILLDNEKIKEE